MFQVRILSKILIRTKGTIFWGRADLQITFLLVFSMTASATYYFLLCALLGVLVSLTLAKTHLFIHGPKVPEVCSKLAFFENKPSGRVWYFDIASTEIPFVFF